MVNIAPKEVKANLNEQYQCFNIVITGIKIKSLRDKFDSSIAKADIELKKLIDMKP